MDIIDKEKTITHPVEELLNIEPNTTVVPYKEVTTELVAVTEYDEKDTEIEQQFETVFSTALSAYENSKENAELVDPKFAARNNEVAAVFLNTALSAVREKALLKQHKDKVEITKQTAGKPGTVNNNLIVADRNEILRTILGQKD